VAIRILGPDEYGRRIHRLAAILQDAVASGAGVSFMMPLSTAEARAFWQGFAASVAAGQTLVFIAEHEDEIAGCVLMQKSWAPNQPHRCDVAKLLVHRDYRRMKFGTALMGALEAEARRQGLALITFDAVAHGPVDKFYRGLGFICIGVIPGYAYSGNNQLDDTAIFYKKLA
jgi:GNAT superfamily N-acetyltransferase